MPKVSVHYTRQMKELIGKFLKNEKFKDYFFGQVQEIIKLDIDEAGVKAENEGGIKMLRKCARKTEEVLPKHIIVDKSFWFVMKEVGKEPYLVSQINEPK